MIEKNMRAFKPAPDKYMKERREKLRNSGIAGPRYWEAQDFFVLMEEDAYGCQAGLRLVPVITVYDYDEHIYVASLTMPSGRVITDTGSTEKEAFRNAKSRAESSMEYNDNVAFFKTSNDIMQYAYRMSENLLLDLRHMIAGDYCMLDDVVKSITEYITNEGEDGNEDELDVICDWEDNFLYDDEEAYSQHVHEYCEGFLKVCDIVGVRKWMENICKKMEQEKMWYANVEKKHEKRKSMMAKTYTHYGKEVIFQDIIEDSFKNVLKKEGVEYTDLPIIVKECPEASVITYMYNDKKRYALLIPSSSRTSERCFITESIPEDCDFFKLAMDVMGQSNGEAPKKMKTKAKMLLEMAVEKAKQRIIDETIKEKGLEGYLMNLSLNEKAVNEETYYELIYLHSSIDEISEMDHHDVDEKWIEDIKESIKM